MKIEAVLMAKAAVPMIQAGETQDVAVQRVLELRKILEEML